MSNEQEFRNALPIGYQLHEYRIERVLGAGGFGITYLARDTNLDQLVAIKEFLPNELAMREGATIHPKSQVDKESYRWGLERFVQEAQTLARFNHPNIVQVFRFFQGNNTTYMVMRYEEGHSLDQLLDERQEAVDEDSLLSILMPLLDGLEKIHQFGFLHRDIKPGNIFVRLTDETPVLLDFGAARAALVNRGKSLTTVVTPGYAPFEQYYSDGNQGPWSDIYALAAVMYRLITGTAPPEAPKRERNDPMIPVLEAGRGRFSESLLKAIDWALRVDEGARPQDVAVWKAAIQGNLAIPSPSSSRPREEPPPNFACPPTSSGPFTDRPPITGKVPPPVVAPPKKQLNKPLVMVAAAFLLIVVLAGIWWENRSPVSVLHVGSQPAGATVHLDGKEVGLTPLSLADARQGQHTLRLMLDRYREVEKEFLLEAGQNLNQQFTLEPLPQGAVHVVSTPPGAEVTIDGKEVGRTPLTVDRLEQGVKSVLLKLDDHAEWKGEARIKVQETVELQVELLSRFGALEIASDPSGAQVALDGEPVGKTPVNLVRVPTGLRKLTLTLPPCAHGTGEVEIRPGRTTVYHSAMEGNELIFQDGGCLTPAQAAERRSSQESREAKVRELLQEGEKQLAAKRLHSPAGKNAIESFRQVLALSPDHPEARSGLDRVVDAYVQLAEDAMSGRAWDKADGLLKKAEALAPERQPVVVARKTLDQLRKALKEETGTASKVSAGDSAPPAVKESGGKSSPQSGKRAAKADSSATDSGTGSTLDAPTTLKQLLALLKAREGAALELCEADWGSKSCNGKAIMFPPMSNIPTIGTVDRVSLLAVEPGSSPNELQGKLSVDATVNVVPNHCTDSKLKIRMDSPEAMTWSEIVIDCSWIIIGNVGGSMIIRFDYVDLEKKMFGGRYRIGVDDENIGSSKGYLLLKL